MNPLIVSASCAIKVPFFTPVFSLLLSDLWVEDEGVYICEAHNHFGKIQTQARVTVTGLGTSRIWFDLCLFVFSEWMLLIQCLKKMVEKKC